MSSLKATLRAGAAVVVAALSPTASAAYAADGGSGGGEVSVTPSAPSPGAEVSLGVRGCIGKTGTAASAAFVADARLTGTGGTLAGETRVRSSLTPGSYPVTIVCADFRVKGTIRVVAGSANPSVYASPVAPVRAGGGGAAPLTTADEARVDGPGTAHAITGLVLAGVAAVVVALRTVRRSRGTD
ncbi:hypothetical protein [Streptomyces aurantiogriseus]|uniref:Secreted protein n=1 Tax=Streptomyces aurantiogriseus TaxID=66870 RepID=A0A918FIU7_9ACTN|nr:hypothetical protein [Streptomyces aurantiogriseus]GGR40226.1 hypothetical protein GCM10010251_66190 [Streptomyces aurantiogriseus]